MEFIGSTFSKQILQDYEKKQIVDQFFRCVNFILQNSILLSPEQLKPLNNISNHLLTEEKDQISEQSQVQDDQQFKDLYKESKENHMKQYIQEVYKIFPNCILAIEVIIKQGILFMRSKYLKQWREKLCILNYQELTLAIIKSKSQNQKIIKVLEYDVQWIGGPSNQKVQEIIKKAKSKNGQIKQIKYQFVLTTKKRFLKKNNQLKKIDFASYSFETAHDWFTSISKAHLITHMKEANQEEQEIVKQIEFVDRLSAQQQAYTQELNESFVLEKFDEQLLVNQSFGVQKLMQVPIQQKNAKVESICDNIDVNQNNLLQNSFTDSHKQSDFKLNYILAEPIVEHVECNPLVNNKQKYVVVQDQNNFTPVISFKNLSPSKSQQVQDIKQIKLPLQAKNLCPLFMQDILQDQIQTIYGIIQNDWAIPIHFKPYDAIENSSKNYEVFMSQCQFLAKFTSEVDAELLFNNFTDQFIYDQELFVKSKLVQYLHDQQSTILEEVHEKLSLFSRACLFTYLRYQFSQKINYTETLFIMLDRSIPHRNYNKNSNGNINFRLFAFCNNSKQINQQQRSIVYLLSDMNFQQKNNSLYFERYLHEVHKVIYRIGLKHKKKQEFAIQDIDIEKNKQIIEGQLLLQEQLRVSKLKPLEIPDQTQLQYVLDTFKNFKKQV